MPTTSISSGSSLRIGSAASIVEQDVAPSSPFAAAEVRTRFFGSRSSPAASLTMFSGDGPTSGKESA